MLCGKIDIELVSLASGQLRLSVHDNGVGFPSGIDYRETETLGLRLVNSLCQQIGGTMELATNQGTHVSVMFTDTP